MTTISNPPRLLKVLGVAFGLAMIVGNTIGAGILRSPGEVAAALPSSAWFIGAWIAGGVYALLGAMTMAELTVMIPKSGGQYVYARRALGEYPAFVIGWTDWFSTCGAVAAVSIGLGELAREVVPSMAGQESVVAIAVLVVFTAIHWVGVKSGDRVQQLLSLMKAVTLLAVAAACFGKPAAPLAEQIHPTLPTGLAFVTALVFVFQNVLYSYDGWNGITYFGGEMKDPGREVPRAMAYGVVAVLVVYLALNAAYLHVLGMGGLAGDKFPAASAANVVFGSIGMAIVRAVMAVTLLGSVNAILMQASRTPYAMSEDNLLPRFVSRVNSGGTPHLSLAASAILTIGLVLSGTFQTVLALSAFFYVMQYAVTFLSLFVLRRREPDAPRAYMAWGYPWIPGLVLFGALAFIVGNFVGDRANSIRAVVVIAASYPLYLTAKRLLRG
ncbi:MAG TPA: APC family permease [Gemmatimonadaceae bacterium]|nr:APC family permease [Gemmatimonadaceae bacterium]